jgi:class 3 adenylate cyclase/tetratricopeptide (TPR) repeat protein
VPQPDASALDSSLLRRERVVLYADLVEYVRLIEQDETATVELWLKVIDLARERILKDRGGRFVKGLGDGLVAEFAEPRDAVGAAFDLHDLCKRLSADLPEGRRMFLRIGIERGPVLIRDKDVYGHGVNVAQRIASIAAPGETVVSAAARDGLVDMLDCEIEDLGECWLKHVTQPVRAYRVGRSGRGHRMERTQFAADLRPTIAVLPFATVPSGAGPPAIGEIIADAVIHALSRSAEINVISRLSTSAVGGRGLAPATIGEHLAADYLLGGTVTLRGRRVHVDAQLCDARTGHVIWSDRMSDDARAILDPHEQALIGQIASAASAAIVTTELRRARSLPLPTLRSYTLLLSAVALMHRLSPADFAESRKLLEALIERAPRQAEPHSWLANWYALKVIQGWSQDIDADARTALAHSSRALDADPECARALAINGFVQLHLRKRFDLAAESFDHALACNPNEGVAWAMRGAMHAFSDRGAEAIEDTEAANRLSPLDPHRFFTDTLRASARLTAGDHEGALWLARQARRANRLHASTLRTLAVAQQETGQTQEARQTVAELLRIEPDLTVGKYLGRAPSAGFEIGRRIARALQAAGVPA